MNTDQMDTVIRMASAQEHEACDYAGMPVAADVTYTDEQLAQAQRDQRFQTHFFRNMLDVCPKKLQLEMRAALKSLYEADDRDTTVLLRDSLIISRFRREVPKAATLLEDSFEDVMTVLTLPFSMRRRLRTTNRIERLNEEIRRMERVIRIFPNESSLYRLLGALLMEIHDSWQSGKVYLDVTSYLSQRAQPFPARLGHP